VATESKVRKIIDATFWQVQCVDFCVKNSKISKNYTKFMKDAKIEKPVIANTLKILGG